MIGALVKLQNGNYNMLGSMCHSVILPLLSCGARLTPLLTLYDVQLRSQMGGQGVRPPGKSQVIGVSIGNKQLDPPPPLENV